MRAALGLGSNQGDRRRHLERAVEGLRAHGAVVALSSFLETEPVGGPPQGRYLNAALLLETELGPRALLEAAQALEKAAGRVRTVRWAPRPLDVDLLLCDDLTLDRPGLALPHPRLHERRFVLQPLAEIAPAWVVPGLHRTVEELLAELSLHS